MPDLASLNVVLTTTGGEATAAAQVDVAATAERAEASANKLTDALVRQSTAMERTAKTAKQVALAEKEAAAVYDGFSGKRFSITEVADVEKPAKAIGLASREARGFTEYLHHGMRPAIHAATDSMLLMGVQGDHAFTGLSRAIFHLISGAISFQTIGIAAVVVGISSLIEASHKADEAEQKQQESLKKSNEYIKSLREETERLVIARKSLNTGVPQDVITSEEKLKKAQERLDQLQDKKFGTGGGRDFSSLIETHDRLAANASELLKGGFDDEAEVFIKRKEALVEANKEFFSELAIQKSVVAELKDQLDITKKKVEEENKFTKAVGESDAALSRSQSAEDLANKRLELDRLKKQRAEGSLFVETPLAGEIAQSQSRIDQLGRKLATRVVKPGQAFDAEGEELKTNLDREEKMLELLREEQKLRQGIAADEKARKSDAEKLKAQFDSDVAQVEKNKQAAITARDRDLAGLEKKAELQAKLDSITSLTGEDQLRTASLLAAKQQELAYLDEHRNTDNTEITAKLKDEVSALTDQLGLQKAIEAATKRQRSELQERAQLFERLDRRARSAAELDPNKSSKEVEKSTLLDQITAKQEQIAFLDAHRTKDHDELVDKLNEETAILQEQIDLMPQLEFARAARSAGDEFGSSISSGISGAFKDLAKTGDWKTFTSSLASDLQESVYQALIAGIVQASGIKEASASVGSSIFQLGASLFGGNKTPGAGDTGNAAADAAGSAAEAVGSSAKRAPANIEATFIMAPDEATADQWAATLSHRGKQAIVMDGGGTPGVRGGILRNHRKKG